MEELPVFSLFPDPWSQSIFDAEDFVCDGCGKPRSLKYALPLYSDQPLGDPHFCPWCISDGTAAARGFRFNSAMDESLPDDIEQMPEEDKALVERRTPGFFTWQQGQWLVCCSRAMVYLGEAKAEDARGRWKPATGDMIADLKRLGYDEKGTAEMLDQIGGGHICMYVFRCQVCAKLRSFWDLD